jgi:hypothetical protein
MIDKTTVGVTAEQEEVEAVLHSLCGYHLAEPDPLFRYNVLTREQVLYEALAAAIKRERGRALADLTHKGHTLTQIAGMTNLVSRQRVQRLITISKAAEDAAAEVQAASREFHERLAAVEATLDEVVSGLIPATSAEPEPAEVAGVVVSAGEVPAPLPAHHARFEDLTVEVAELNELPDPDMMLEPTQALPALQGLLHPTREMPSSQEEAIPWWRRGRDTGAA